MKSYGFSFPCKSNNERESFSDCANISEAWSINSLQKDGVLLAMLCYYYVIIMI